VKHFFTRLITFNKDVSQYKILSKIPPINQSKNVSRETSTFYIWYFL